jgi:hypothetical protein
MGYFRGLVIVVGFPSTGSMYWYQICTHPAIASMGHETLTLA